VAELATSNIFMAKDGVVFTPVANGTFLAGITRRRVIGLLRQSGVTVVEKSLTTRTSKRQMKFLHPGTIPKSSQQPGSAGAHSHSVRFLAEHENSIGHSHIRDRRTFRKSEASRRTGDCAYHDLARHRFLDRGARVNPMPTSTMVEVLTPIWQRVLQLPSVGADDNFFDLGGDSALALELFNEVALACGRELPPVTIYHAPTISALAALLEQPTSARIPPLIQLKAGSDPPVFLAHGLGGSAMDFFRL